MLTMGMPIVMAIAGVGVLIFVVSSAEIAAPVAVPFLLVWVGFVGFFAYQMLRMPSTIEWQSNGTVVFRGLIRSLSVPISEIQSIRPRGNGLGFLEIRFAGGRLQLLNQFDEFHDFLSRLKAENPKVELRGC
jgi:hypothetical protein